MTAPALPPRLTLGVKISYGLGSVAQSVAGVALSTSILNFYFIRVLGLRPAVVGVVILASLVIDAVVDPAIGRLSDTSRSPWGRRHPFMYASAAPIAIAIFLLWRQPPGLSPDAIAVYALVMLITLRLCTGFYQIPSDALSPELAPDYHDRTSLISFRYFFGIVGGVGMSLLLYEVLLPKNASHPLGLLNRAGYEQFGLIAGVTVFVAILVSSAATHRYIPYLQVPPRRRLDLAKTLREIAVTLTNPAMLVVMVAGLLSGVAGGVAATLGNFMALYFWGLSPQVIGLIGAVTAPAAILGVLAAPFISRRLDKKRAMLIVFFASIFSGVIPTTLRLLGLLPPNGSPWIPPILAAEGLVSGTLSLVGYVIIGSMVADITEDSAVRTGVRSEGLLFATSGLLPKVTIGLGGLLGNMMLEAARFPTGAATGGADRVDPLIMRHLVYLSLPTTMLLNLAAVSALFFYRLNRQTHESNLEALRLAGAVTEPPTSIASAPQPFVDPGAFSGPP